MNDFFRTRMGMTFFERTLPELVLQLTRIADLLERLVDTEDASKTRPDGHVAKEEE